MFLAKPARVTVVVLALSLGASTAAVAADTSSSPPPPHLPSDPAVTLITGDRVTTGDDGTASIEAGPGRENIHFATYRQRDHFYVIPSDASSLVADGSIDKRLFDVTTLRESGYDDAARPDLPLIVSQAGDQPLSVPSGSTITQALPSLNGSGLSATKSELGALWNSVTGLLSGNRVLSEGVERIWLDGKREVNLDRSASQIGAPQAWDNGVTGKGTTVAVLDTGVDQTHPDLADREAAQRNFTDAPTNVDNFGHGTHVAGIVAGTGAFSKGKYRGIAHGAKVLDGKVLNDSGSGQESWIIAGMEWAAEKKADVANLSLGGTDAPGIDPLEKAVNDLSANSDTLYVIAAGNDGPSEESVGSPGSADAALTVGAVNRKDGLAPFSSRGPRVGDGGIKPDITAPGVGIVSALHSKGSIGEPIDGRYTKLDGTSMASPHVAGAAALLAQTHPNFTGEQLKATLTASALPNPGLSAFEQGSGRVDVPAALAQTVTSEPGNVSFGTQLWPHDDDKPVTKPLTYRNSGDTDVTLDLAAQAEGPGGKPAPEGMFTVDKPRVTVPAGGTAKVMITTNTKIEAADGTYSGAVVATAGKTKLTTPLAVTREVESYDVTVNNTGPDGKPTGKATTQIFQSNFSDMEQVPPGKPKATVRLPKGQYKLQTILYTGGQNDQHSYFMVQPRLDVSEETTVDLDFRKTKPVSVTPPDAKAKSVLGTVGYELPREQLTSSILGTDINTLSTAQLGAALPPEELISQINSTWTGKSGDYHLAWFEPGKLPTGFQRDVKPGDVATVHSDFGTPLPNRSGSRGAYPLQADGPSAVALATPIDVPLPSKRDVFYNTDGVRWSSFLAQNGPQGQLENNLQSPPQTYEAGKEYRYRFNYAPFAPAFPSNPLLGGWVLRSNDTIAGQIPLFSDRFGNSGLSSVAKGNTTLHRGEELIGKVDQPGTVSFQVPPESGKYRLSTEANQPDGTELSTKVSASWTFDSAHTNKIEPLPLSAVRFDPALDDDNTAPAGKHEEVPLYLQNPAGNPVPFDDLAVQVSYDEGKTWVDAPLIGTEKVALDYPADAKSVSLRTSASDQPGTSVEQTVIRAYKLRN